MTIRKSAAGGGRPSDAIGKYAGIGHGRSPDHAEFQKGISVARTGGRRGAETLKRILDSTVTALESDAGARHEKKIEY